MMVLAALMGLKIGHDANLMLNTVLITVVLILLVVLMVRRRL